MEERKMAETDMTFRILEMYETFIQGKEIEKSSFCMEHGISNRTFDRDIEKIRIFLSETYSGHEVEYNPRRECYFIPGIRERKELSFLEASILIKILKGEKILEKNEFAGMVQSLQSVTERRDEKNIQQIIKKEFREYEEKVGRKAFLKLFGDLQKCIEERNIIRIKMKERGSNKLIGKYFCPVAIELLNPDFYLLGYKSEEDAQLIIFKLEEIESFQVTLRKYGEEVTQRYCYQEGQYLLKQIRKEEEKM